MELILFTGAAITAFALAGTPILVWAYARRARQLREALEASLARLAELESGAPPNPAREPAPKPAAEPLAPPEPALRLPEPPPPSPEPPPPVFVNVEAIAEPPPKPRRRWWGRPKEAPPPIEPEEAPPPPRPMAPRPAPAPEPAHHEPPLREPEPPPRPTPNLPARRDYAPVEDAPVLAEAGWAGMTDAAPPAPEPAAPLDVGALVRASLSAAIFVALAAGALWAVPAAQLSPTAALVIAAIAGLGAIGAGEWMSRLPAPANHPAGPAVLIGAGLAILAAAIAVAARVHAALPPSAAFVLIASAAFTAFAYARRLGLPLFLEGLALTLLAPALIPLPPTLAPVQHAFLLGALIFVLWDANPRPAQRVWRLIAIAGAVGWTSSSVYGLSTPLEIAPAFGAAIAFICAGLLYAAPHAAAPLPLRAWRRDGRWSERALLGCALMLAAMLMQIGFAFAFTTVPAMAATTLVLAIAIVAFAACAFEGLGFPAVLVGALAALAIAIWPNAAAPAAISAAAGIAIVATIAGWVAMVRARDPTPGALLAALIPIAALFAAYLRFGPIGGADNWASAAAVLAGLNLLLHVRMRGSPRDAFCASIFALGAVLAAGTAIGVYAPAPFNIAALGAFLPILALFDHAANQRGLRIGAGVLALAAIITAVQAFTPHPPWTFAPWLEPHAPALAFAGAMMLLAALLFARGGSRAAAFIVRILTLLAFVALAAALAAQVRAGGGGGRLDLPAARVWEAGAYAILAIAVSLGAAWRERIRPDGFAYALFWLAYAAAAACFVAAAAITNPWWGAAPATVAGPAIANELALAYAAPALAALAAAWLFDRWRSPVRVIAMGALALAGFGLWLALEHRRLFHADAMSAAPVTPAEAWSLTAVIVAYAGAAYWLGLRLSLRWLMQAGQAIALAALAKAALLDAPALTGAARIAAFAGLVIAAAAVLIYNHRLMPAGPHRTPDPNLMPPR